MKVVSGFIFFIFSFVSVTGIGELLPPGVYRIQNVEDGKVLTATKQFQFIPGRFHQLSNVIVSDWEGLPEQQWKIEDSPLGVPEQYSLTPKKFDRNRVTLWAPEKFYEVPVEWHLIYLGSRMWHVKNKDTEKCLINWGRFRDVDEWRCDKYDKTQQWQMHRL